MERNTRQLVIHVNEDLYEDIQFYRFSTRKNNLSEAVRSILAKGLDRIIEEEKFQDLKIGKINER